MKTMRTKVAAFALATAVAVGGGVAFTQSADAQVDQSAREERLQELVDEGVITEERADEIRARMAERAAAREERRANRTERLEELAATLGTTADELRADLRAGASLAEIATAAGVDIEVIIDQIEAQMTDRINQAVLDGRIDADQAATKLESLTERVTDRVNGERPEGRRGFGPRGLRGPRGGN